MIMPQLPFGPRDCLFYEYTKPDKEAGCTFVFFNALTGDTSNWEDVMGPTVREKGHGTLVYNMRGQSKSLFSKGLRLDADLVIEDAGRLLGHVKPMRPVFVGLSIGGLFAIRAWLAGAESLGMVLVNTLRRDGARLQWIGDAMVRAAEVGGLDLFRDLYLPLLMSETWQADNRMNFLKPETYRPIARDSGHYKLLSEAGRSADWEIPYERLDLPVLVVTGLQDRVFLDLNDVDELFARLPDGRRLDQFDAGHLIPMERPEALAVAIMDFAAEL
jgi:pimeloyl-ACP methyl ester carboxylesterase